MNNRLLNIITLVLLLGTMVSCEREECVPDSLKVPEGFMPVSFVFSAPGMQEVATKAVDPDGKGVNSMILFCFDNFGMYINHKEVKSSEINHLDGSYPYLKGKIENTLIPENTRRIHFVANQNTSSFDEGDFWGKSEGEIMSTLEGSSGMMIYWGYYATDGATVADSEDFKKKLEADHGSEAKALRLLRNQARFMVDESASDFIKTGFAVVNTNAFGTVAPYHPQKGFNFSMVTTGSGDSETWADCDWTNTDFITLPENKTRLTPPIDVDIASETCVFETDNNSAHPVSIIIKGKNSISEPELYYRVILMDVNGNFIKVRRNFTYTVNVTGPLSYGQETFDQALTAPATNNIWLSIDDDVKNVSDGKFTLSVHETSVTVLARKELEEWVLSRPSGQNYELKDKTDGTSGAKLMLKFTLEDNATPVTITNADVPDVLWVEGSNLSTVGIDKVFSTGTGGNNGFGEGEFEVDINNLAGLESADKLEGTVLIKKDKLQRKVKITVLKEMSLRPVWVSTQVNKLAGDNVTLLFTVPESCPDELLPFDVYISVNHLDIRHTSDRTFPIITRLSDPLNYGIDTYSHYEENDGVFTPASGESPIGYKYVYTVTQKGDQRMYFTNMITRTDLHVEYITIESPYFSTVHKPFTFNTEGDHRIELPFLEYVDANENGGMDDDEVKYILIPQKINYRVDFDFAVTEKLSDGTFTDVDALSRSDEFFIYTENLSHSTADDHVCNWEFENYHPAYDNLYSSGTVMAFRARNASMAASRKEGRNIFNLYMYTQKANTEEIIRISSNHIGSPSPWGGNYAGNGYRSIIFELANYHPFHFNAKVNGIGDIVTGSNEEVVNTVPVAYAPDTDIAISLDIESFEGADGNDVDPFGYPFHVYIVAPMLDVGTSGTDEIAPGVFAYRVDAAGSNAITTLNFAKKGIVSDGEVLITTDPVLAGVSGIAGHERQVVNFYNKKFKITSSPIKGSIQIKNGSGLENMLEGAFVSFALERNNSRIGSMKIYGADADSDGFNTSWYELILRSEYNFNWNTDQIIITHTHGTGAGTEVFSLGPDGITLDYLLQNGNIVLEEEEIE